MKKSVIKVTQTPTNPIRRETLNNCKTRKKKHTICECVKVSTKTKIEQKMSHNQQLNTKTHTHTDAHSQEPENIKKHTHA